MPRVAFSRWQYGFKKIDFAKLLRAEAGLGLAEGKPARSAVPRV